MAATVISAEVVRIVEQRFALRLVSEKRITYVKVGRKIRFRQSTIEAYIIANTVSAQRSRPSSRR